MIGKTISHYKISEKLGEGGMGIVYKAFDTMLERTIALKLLRPETIGDPDVKKRFIREARAASKLNHPNITTIYEIDEWHGRDFISMEFVEGQTLREKVKSGPLPIEEILQIAEQVAEALQEAHEHNIVHRDIKSENIMVTPKGQVKVMDFGLAKLKGMDTVTKIGTTIGTVAYMSPEQARGEEVDFRTDIWSFGVVLYEMLTGQLPFKGDYEQAVIYSILNQEPTPISELRSNVPTTFQDIVKTALKKQQDQRYQCVDEIFMALKNVRQEINPDVVISKKKSVKARHEKRRSQHKHFSAATIRNSLKNRVGILVFTSVLFLVAVVLLLMMYLSQREPKLYENRIAVTTFENRSGDPALDNMGRIAADWIVQGLVETELVSVVPVIDSAMAGSHIQILASQTQAQFIITGSYHKQDEQLQFHAQIYDAKKREIKIALDPVIGSPEDPNSTIELLRQRILGGLANTFDPRLKAFDITLQQPPKYEALSEFITGMDHFVNLEYDDALKYFNKAIELEPGFVRPLEASAWIHYNRGQYVKADSMVHRIRQIKVPIGLIDQYRIERLAARLKGDYSRALSASQKLVRLSPTQGHYFQLGFDALQCNRPREAIEAWENVDPHAKWKKVPFFWDFLTFCYHILVDHKKELELARQGREQLSESLYTPYYELRALAALGKIEDFFALLDESLSLPSQGRWTHGGLMRSTAEALRAHGFNNAAQKMLERAIDWYLSHPIEKRQPGLANALYKIGRLKEAHSLYDSLHHEDPDNIDYLGHLGIIAAKIGNKDEANRISQLFEEMEDPYLFGNHTYFRACIAAQLGEINRAMTLIKEARNQGAYIWQFVGEIDLEPLWDFPEFQKFLKPKG